MSNINDLKKEFTLIVIIRNDIQDLFNVLLLRIKKLKDIYEEIIKTNMTSQFIFGLDSFKFQSKIMDVECEDLCRLYRMVSNKMYCEYYKLYKMIVKYVETTIKDTKLLYLTKTIEFPIYKDLEPFKEYDFSTIQNIHETILTILVGINDLVLNNKEEVKLLKNKKDYGFNIDNFINSFQYNIDTIVQQIKLYADYVAFFHKTHLKYLRRIHTKLRLFSEQINNDIRFDDTENEYKYDLDKSTVESVKSMIYDEDFEMDAFLTIVNEHDESLYESLYISEYDSENKVIEENPENQEPREETQNVEESQINIETQNVEESQINIETQDVETEKIIKEVENTPKKRGRPRKKTNLAF